MGIDLAGLQETAAATAGGDRGEKLRREGQEDSWCREKVRLECIII